MQFSDLREFTEIVKTMGDLREVEGADWNLEIGAITEVAGLAPDPPMLLFDKIKDFPAGYRVVSNVFAAHKRIALALGLPTHLSGVEIAKVWKEKMRGFKLVPPEEVSDGPIMENVIRGDKVDLARLRSCLRSSRPR